MSTSAPPTWEPQLFNLWPTFVVHRSIEDHEQHDAALVELVETLDRDSEQLTASQWQDIDFMSREHPSVEWLRTRIEETARAYCDAVGMNYAIGWNISGWPNINRMGDYHAPHNHAWSYLSGTYYVRVPQPSVEVSRESDATSAGITFYDPRSAVNMLAVAGEAISRREFPARPVAGTLLMWHSALYHTVHPNLSETPRISLSFNMTLAWSDQDSVES